jgi:5'-deoxynucleotidase
MHNFLALAMRQQLIRRWSLMRCVTPESVLEHSASVALLTLIAGSLARQQGKEVNLERLMAHAIVHDMSEVFCSDIVTPVKKANPTLEAEFRKLEKAAETQLIDSLPEELRTDIGSYFELSGYEHKLFKACDTYAAWIKCKLEIAAGNSGEFLQAFDTLNATLDGLKGECPEIETLDTLFGAKIGESVDQLMS